MALFDKISLFDYLKDESELLKINKGKDVNVSSPESLALLAALSFKQKPRKMFFLFPTMYEAERFSQFLGDYVEEEDSYFFPYDEIFRVSAIGISQEMNEERLLAISSVFSDRPSILVAHASSCMMHIMSKDNYLKNILSFCVGDFFLLKDIIEKISRLGYVAVDSVTNINQFAVRGGIIDVFDAAYENPIRIEFFGDEVDDIRFFNTNNELSFEHVKDVTIHPATLRLITEENYNFGKENIKNNLEKATNIVDKISYDDLIDRLANLLNESKNGYISEVDSRFYSLFNKDENCLLDYLDGYDKYLYCPMDIDNEKREAYKKEKNYFNQAVLANNSIFGEKVYVDKAILFNDFSSATINDQAFIIRDNSFKSLSYSESFYMLEEYFKEGYSVRVVLPEPNLSNYDNYLNGKSISHSFYPNHSPLMLVEGKLTHGFEIPERKHVYLSAKEIFGVSDQKSRFLSRYKEAKIIRKYEDLKEGDFVVHEVHGVGKYLGVITMNGLEYLKIQYAGDAMFYLPLSQYRLIRKYSSREGFTPTLDRLGGSTWSRKKSRIRAKISFLADQLLMLYAERKNRPGFAFPKEGELTSLFKENFPYPYTSSQLQAIEDVDADMESTHPMDRLIAGDVGFGKTEVAFNAAFKAILAHKQVVLLCPTTILSNQHYKVALERFKGFDVHISVFNRFVPKQKQEKIIKDLSIGKIDFIIGTHALLSDDILFKDLGLLIIDEEQKFGVAHKERIKEKAKDVDCLTLTATPIPRTMQMSLLGVRSMSLLSQPPIDRMPVKTYIAKQDDELIFEVIDKELNRNGQVYYLHNNISDITDIAKKLQEKFPNSRVGTVHAKMNQNQIEDIMNQFYQCDVQILVCTSIIESGLDIPNVNTIIVENADHFGLAQLYQIKGRVGRSDRLAYAYFFFSNKDKITDEGQKRLKAMKDFTELGSGYKIAMQDLNIRGAGDILGSEQAGFVDTLGYDAYMDLLNAVVKEKQLVTDALDEKYHPDFELSFSLDAHIPSDYGNESQRITMYKELSDCKNDEDLAKFSHKIRDVYGPYSEEVSGLLIKRKIEIYLNSSLYSNFVEALGIYTITMSDKFSSKPQIYKRIDELLQPLAVKLRFKINSSRQFEFVLIKSRDYLSDLLFLVENLQKAYEVA